MTLVVFILDKFIVLSDKHPQNILLISVTFPVFKLDKSNYVGE